MNLAPGIDSAELSSFFAASLTSRGLAQPNRSPSLSVSIVGCDTSYLERRCGHDPWDITERSRHAWCAQLEACKRFVTLRTAFWLSGNTFGTPSERLWNASTGDWRACSRFLVNGHAGLPNGGHEIPPWTVMSSSPPAAMRFPHSRESGWV